MKPKNVCIKAAVLAAVLCAQAMPHALAQSGAKPKFDAKGIARTETGRFQEPIATLGQ